MKKKQQKKKKSSAAKKYHHRYVLKATSTGLLSKHRIYQNDDRKKIKKE